MLDMKYVVQNAEAMQANCLDRRVNLNVSELVQAYKQRNSTTQEIEKQRNRQNIIAAQIPLQKDPQIKAGLIEEGKQLKTGLVELEKRLSSEEALWRSLLCKLPNQTHPLVPKGGEEDGKEIKRVGEPTKFSFSPLDHLQLADKLQLIDFEAGTLVAGQKFYFLKNQAVFLELALVRYALDLLVKRGFTATITPDLAKPEILEGIGFSPRGSESNIYSVENHDLCLIGTSEIPIGGSLRNAIIDEARLPLKIAGFSHCFRTEAGALGRESKGLYRVHQFSKVEMFAFVHPSKSDAMHEEFLQIEEEIFQGLEIPYRVIDIASGDLGNPAYRKFDIEAWMPGRGTPAGSYGEVTSASNCTDFQARRLNIRYRDAHGKVEPLHTLNGTAVAISRALIALLENGQQADGSVRLPKVLHPYLGFTTIS